MKGMTITDASAYLRQQPGVDAHSVSISIHSVFGNSNTLPYNTSQIKVNYIYPTSLPDVTLPALPSPAVTPSSQASTV
jgi:hypothetical protein